jgi:transposase
MIPSGVEIFVGLSPIDLRWGIDRLSGLVEEQTGRVARSGALFVFFGKRKNALKVLFADSGGMCLFYKRLDRHVFRVPTAITPGTTTIELNEREFDDLLDAIEIEVVVRKSRSKRSVRLH